VNRRGFGRQRLVLKNVGNHKPDLFKYLLDMNILRVLSSQMKAHRSWLVNGIT
jgi:hypothetical protein